MIKGRINIARILLSSILFLLSSIINAETSSIHRQLSEFIEQQISTILLPSDRYSYDISSLNQQFKFSSCSVPLSFQPSRPLIAGKFSIKVSCDAAPKWSFYSRGEIDIQRTVIVTAQSLPKGMPLTPENTEPKAISLQKLRGGYFTSYKEINDFTLKRAVTKGSVLTPQVLTPPLLVRKNDEVIIIAGRPDRIEVRVSGTALQDGRMNQQIRVRNQSSGKTIKARVINRGIVRADY